MAGFLAHASRTYALGYFGLIIVISLLEWAFPRRRAGETLSRRWIGNFGILILNSFIVRLLFPLVGAAWAVFCRDRGWGLINHAVLPAWVAVTLTILLLDLQTYAQHCLLHHVSALWRVHRAHHTDQAFDFTTGVRFHPGEAVLSTAAGLVLIALLGAPPLGVLLFEFLTAAIAFFEHANLRVPSSLDRALRLVFVTPDMHCVHHSRAHHEGNSNLGSLFSWWDRLFGTYRAAPDSGHDRIEFGVAGFTDRKHLALQWMLLAPWLGPRGTLETSTTASQAIAKPPGTR